MFSIKTYICRVLKAFKYRIYPTKAQEELLNKHIGCVRFVYNLALETKQSAYVSNQTNLSCFDLIKQLPELKEECVWLKEVNAQSLQQSITNLDKAYTSFFKGRGNYPVFKKKSNTGSFCVPQGVRIENGRLLIPKFKCGIRIVLHRSTEGSIKNAVVSRTVTGKYFVSVLCETGKQVPKKPTVKENLTVGVDLGIKTFVVASNGNEYDNPKHLRKSLERIRYVHRKFSRNKGKRTKRKLAILHEKVANQRKDFLHKVSSELIRENQSIAVETLQVSNMMKNHNLALSIQDAGWGMFLSMLEYKAEWNGRNILKVGTFEPSSKMCSCCGHVNKYLTLKDRVWTCVKCNSVLHRDLNASLNIKNFALKNVLSGTDRKNRNELPTLVGVMTSEAPKG